MLHLIQGLLKLPEYLRVVPCHYKRPLIKNWEQLTNAYNPNQLARELQQNGGWYAVGKWGEKQLLPTTGFGLVCGAYPQGYLVAIDCDGTTGVKTFKSLHLPKSVAFTSGKPNRAQILYYVEPKISSFKNVKHQLEIRGSGHQSLLPPSSHPKTTGYYWLHSPRSVEIARINSDRLKVLRPIRKPKTNYGNNHDLLQAQRLLWQIHPKYADDYWHWLSIGMALHSVDFSLLEDWDTWSQHSKKYKPKECAYKWNSFKKQGYTIGTLYYYANLSRVKLIANNVALTPALP